METKLIREMQEIDRQMKEAVPDADMDVLAFITDMSCHSAVNEQEYEALRSTFRAGYCYYFAHMLKLAFNRGEVCWAAPFGHFVWVDDNGVPYDIEGVNFGEQIYNIPEHYQTEEMLKDFKHVPGNPGKGTKAEEIIGVIRKYEDDKGLPHADLSYYHLGDK